MKNAKINIKFNIENNGLFSLISLNVHPFVTLQSIKLHMAPLKFQLMRSSRTFISYFTHSRTEFKVYITKHNDFFIFVIFIIRKR